MESNFEVAITGARDKSDGAELAHIEVRIAHDEVVSRQSRRYYFVDVDWETFHCARKLHVDRVNLVERKVLAVEASLCREGRPDFVMSAFPGALAAPSCQRRMMRDLLPNKPEIIGLQLVGLSQQRVERFVDAFLAARQLRDHVSSQVSHPLHLVFLFCTCLLQEIAVLEGLRLLLDD